MQAELIKSQGIWLVVMMMSAGAGAVFPMWFWCAPLIGFLVGKTMGAFLLFLTKML